jgi:hypothetical protein
LGFNLRSYNLIKEYSFGIERSTGIKNYQLKDCMEGGFIKMKRKKFLGGSLVRGNPQWRSEGIKMPWRQSQIF